MSERHRLRGPRLWLLAGVLFVGAFIAAGLLGEAFGSEPSGPPSSSYATNAEGLAGWAALLERAGHPVTQLRKPLTEARLDPRALLVVLEPEALLTSEGVRLLAFVRSGGTLLIGGSNPERFLPALLPTTPEWSGQSPRRASIVASPGGLLAGVSEVRSAGEGQWRAEVPYRPLLGYPAGGVLLLGRALGHGTLLLIADGSPLQNRLLSAADNAQLALSLAGAPPAPVVFAESVHGFGEARGLAALPARWRVAFGGLLLAALLWALARGRRLGPPQAPESAGRTGAPARAAYIDALSLLLRRAGSPEELASERSRLAEATTPRRLRDGQ